MVEFIKNIDSGDCYMQLFAIARNSEEAFYLWKMAKELKVDVCIDNKMLGNDWEARYAIEKHFNSSYVIPSYIEEDMIFPDMGCK
jgi:hypothetical protein